MAVGAAVRPPAPPVFSCRTHAPRGCVTARVTATALRVELRVGELGVAAPVGTEQYLANKPSVLRHLSRRP